LRLLRPLKLTVTSVPSSFTVTKPKQPSSFRTR
jgi:hypothetical protein